MQRPLRVSSALLALGFAVGCTTPDYTADFATNELFYVDVPWQTKAPGDRAVFVAPLVDARAGATLPVQERGFPIVYGGDEFWERPVTEMFGDVLQRQLAASALFPSLETRATPSTLLLQPTLVAFTTGAIEGMSGSRSFAEVGVRLQVLGPAPASGTRPVLHDQIYANRQTSPMELNPTSPYRLVGRALQQTVQKLLNGLDGSNVARSHVPTAGVTTAEASAQGAR
jgi:hypothetical protein